MRRKGLELLFVFAIIAFGTGSGQAALFQWAAASGGNDHWYDIVFDDYTDDHWVDLDRGKYPCFSLNLQR